MSLLFVTLEATTRLLEPVRSGIGTAASPLLVIAESPYLLGEGLGDVFASRSALQSRNADLEALVLKLSQISQQYLALKAENQQLRELLGSQARVPAEVLIAELIGVVPDPGTHQIIIDKGSADEVTLGQAVIDAEGLFGQIVQVDVFTSRVLLVTDPSHAVPVQVNRNGVRSVAGGTGRRDRLELENVPVTADIREGDLVETSGLGGRFPRGYPVGWVDAMVVEPTASFARVSVRPSAQLDRSRHVLVVFAGGEAPTDAVDDGLLLPEDGSGATPADGDGPVLEVNPALPDGVAPPDGEVP